MIEKFVFKEVYPFLFDWTMILDPNPLKTQLSQLALVQIVKFQCLSIRGFPEFFKTHQKLLSVGQFLRPLECHSYLINFIYTVNTVKIKYEVKYKITKSSHFTRGY